MTAWECPREADVLDAVAAGRWPEGRAGADVELAAHVAACAVCRDLAVVAAALAEEHEAAWTDAAPPPSDVVWWRAQLRARTEAAHAAARPMAVVQGIGAVMALVAVVLVLVGYGGALLTAASGLAAAVMGLATRVPPGAETAAFILRGTLLAVGIWVALIPVAVYLAADE
jgi:hypothetical protein